MHTKIGREKLNKEKVEEFAKTHSKLLQNFSYVTVLQIFMIIAPLITFPYLTRVLGSATYGIVLTAQMLTSYASMFIDFGTNDVCAKHISQNRDDTSKLSEIFSSVLLIRLSICFVCFFIYIIIVSIVPTYREYWIIFLLSYALTAQDVLFPQYFFLGMEQMKYVTFITLSIRLFFIVLVFFLVKNPTDAYLVPFLYSIGYLIGGITSLLIVKRKFTVSIIKPKLSQMIYYMKDCSTIFSSFLISSIKDRFNYLLLGAFAGPSNVVVYDLGLRISSFSCKPAGIIQTVMFPRFAREKNIRRLKQILWLAAIITFIIILVANIAMDYIASFFIPDIQDLMPLRLFTMVPLMLSVSTMIASNFFVAFGYNKHMVYSILVTTAGYLIALCLFWSWGNLESLYTFVIISLISYGVELAYRLLILYKKTRKGVKL